MTKKHDELVGEITQDILEYYRPDGFVEVMRWDREFAERLITLILSAVRDGWLDEELGVVGRFDFHMKNWDTFEHWVAQALHDDADIFIALSGTSQGDPVGGKEEEK